METPLLATKLFVPRPRPGLVARTRLIERLSESRDCPLIVVSGPAGFGKTTILTQWIAEKRPPGSTAWVSLDEGDNDPVRFWDYLIAALRRLRPDVGETASTMLHSPQPYPIESSLTTLINDLTATPGDFALVLDDYHLIGTDAVHSSVAFLVEHLPAGMNVVVSTRVDPDLPLARLRGRGLLLEVRADDLRFTMEETGDLFKELLGAVMPVTHVRALNASTEGWAVGLKMAALSVRGRMDVERFVASFSATNRYVMDYLLEEVLDRQPAEVSDFLLKTSVLERLSGPLCDSLIGSDSSQRILKRLENSNLFIAPLDEVGKWYRYHHLFADLLRHQLEAVCRGEEIKQLHQRASEWYESHDFLDDAIRHSLKINDWERATRLISNTADRLINRGEWRTLSDWFHAVSEEALRSQPQAYAQYANVLATAGNLEAAEAILAYLEKMPDLGEGLRGQLAFFQTLIAYRRGNIKRTVESAEKALALLTKESAAMRARLLHMLGVIDMGGGNLASAESREAGALQAARSVGESWVASTAAGNLSYILWLRGRLRQAAAAGEQAVYFAGQSPGASGPR